MQSIKAKSFSFTFPLLPPLFFSFKVICGAERLVICVEINCGDMTERGKNTQTRKSSLKTAVQQLNSTRNKAVWPKNQKPASGRGRNVRSLGRPSPSWDDAASLGSPAPTFNPLLPANLLSLWNSAGLNRRWRAAAPLTSLGFSITPADSPSFRLLPFIFFMA